jgi:alpha-1,6-mannosyltransferase
VSDKKINIFLVISGLILCGLHILLTVTSFRFEAASETIDKPIYFMTFTLLAAGFIYLLTVWIIGKQKICKYMFLYIFVIGLAIRLVTFPSEPILEDDYFRYLWDGAVSAEGYNPYLYAPDEFTTSWFEGVESPKELYDLADSSGGVVEEINHPWLKTIYPPVAQIIFAAAYHIKPWSINALRFVFLLFDLTLLLIIMLSLKKLSLPRSLALIYWWNPLVIKEVYNAVHMDVIIMPFVLGAVLLSMRKKYIMAAIMLALGMGIKLWPVILLPLVLLPVLKKPKILIPAIIMVGILSLAMLYPIYIGGLGDDSGFTAYGKKWEMNDAAYMVFFWGSEQVLNIFEKNSFNNAHLMARIIVMIILLFVIFRQMRKPDSPYNDLFDKCVIIAAVLFMLSPTQFPWYYLWVIPFMAVKPRLSLVLLSVLLPIYYLRFYYDAIDMKDYFDFGLVWLEYVPVLILLVIEYWRGTHKRLAEFLEVPV